jgi:hypothetical protein
MRWVSLWHAENMKFWQLMSILREDLASLENLLKEGGWTLYATWLKNFNVLVQSRDRQTLDTILPESLVEAALRKCKVQFYIRNGSLYPNQIGRGQESPLTALEAYSRYGAGAVEEALEYGSWRIPEGTC